MKVIHQKQRFIQGGFCMRKKLGALFLIVSLAAGSIGCGNQGVPADTDTKDNTNNVSAEETNTPVSYTQLDVYKRQPPVWLFLRKN